MGSNSTIWTWNKENAVFEHTLDSNAAHDLLPVAIGTEGAPRHLLVESGLGKTSNVYMLSSISARSDFVPRFVIFYF